MEKNDMKKKDPRREASAGLLTNKRGEIRLWLALLMAAALYALCLPALEWLYWTGFNALFRLWGVTDRNIARAPWLVRQFARFSGVLLTVIQSALLFFLSRRLAGWKRLALPSAREAGRGRLCARGAAWGAGSLLALWGALLLIDNMRMSRSLLRPVWSLNSFLLPLTAVLAAAAGLCWGLGLVYRLLARRLPAWAAAALGAALLAPVTLSSAHMDALVMVNTLLCGAVCCLSVRREGSWAWALGFLSALWIMERAVLGFPGFPAALYETYPVNYYFLNGGESGLWHGAAMTFLLLCQAARFIRPIRRKSAS